ncbi:MAG: hypothetical protein GXO80_06715 [Chlorobi bacterium]|nr:hypothetical protein [Chlorobiota bacterium]
MRKTVFFLLIISVLVSCENKDTQEKIPLILVSKDFKNTHKKWLKNSIKDSNFRCVNMYADVCREK